jgi:histidine kinase
MVDPSNDLSRTVHKVNNSKYLKDIPLYGRDNEISALLQAIGNSFEGLQVVWISGASGVGKSKLVQHCFQNNSNFCSGKFDSFPSLKPYAAISKCLSKLCKILSHDDYPKLSVSPDVASVLTKLIPSISNILMYESIEVTSSSQRLRASDSKLDEWGFQKLKQAVHTFVKEACNLLMSISSSPLIFYFDDLQWADSGSLDILKFLLTDSDIWKGFLFIASHRDGNLDKDGSLMTFKTSVEQCKANLTEVSLNNLSKEDVTQLVADAVSNQPSLSEHLATIIFDITGGNAFHVVTALQFLYEKEDMQLSTSFRSWTWNNVEDFSGIGVSSIDILQLFFSRLSAASVEMLKIASCLGLEVEICMLDDILVELNLKTRSESLESLLKEVSIRHLIDIDASNEFFYFLHDQIHFAAYSLIGSEKMRQLLHLRIGRCILSLEEKSAAPLTHGKRLLGVEQLNRGRALIDTAEEKIRLGKLNIVAAEELIAASAFVMAQENLLIVLELIGDDRWNQYYDMAIASHLLLASAYFGNGSMDATLKHINEILRESKNDDDRQRAQILYLEVLSCTSQVKECIELSMNLLSDLGCPKLPRNPGTMHVVRAFIRVKRLLKKMSHEDILNLPECHDCKLLNISKVGKSSNVEFL